MINPHMNALLFERPVWFATGPLVLEEEPQQMEDFTYHRPVLAAEVVELLAPHPGSLVVDGTAGGGGHTEAILKPGPTFWPSIRTPTQLRKRERHSQLTAVESRSGRPIFAMRAKFSTNWEFKRLAARCSISGFRPANSRTRTADSA